MSSAAVQDALRRLRLHCLQNRIRVDMFFRDFDRLRSGIVTRDQFMRVMHMTSLDRIVTPEEFLLIFDEFAARKDPQKVNYANFCDAVDAVFTKKNLEKNPGLEEDEVSSPKSVLASRKPDNELSAEEWDTLQRLTKKFVAEAKARGLILKDFFKDFDRHHNCKVTQAQFHRAFPFRLDPAELAVMLKRYRSNEQFTKGDIEYLRWVQEVDSIIGEPAPTRASAPAHTGGKTKREHDADGLIAELRRHVRQNRFRVDEALRDYDKLRSGFITVNQFQSALGKMRIPGVQLTPHALSILADRYKRSDPQGYTKIAYQRFVDELDEVFTVKGAEKCPSKTMSLDVGQYKNDPKPNILSDEDEARVEQIMTRIRNAVQTRRILLKPMFQDFDRAAKGVYQTRYTSRKRLHRVLAINNIPLSEEEADLLAEKYEAKDAGNSTDNVNYVLFCSHVEPGEAPCAAPTTSAPSPQKKFIRTGKRGVLQLDEVIDDIQAQVLTNRVRLTEFFRDFDQLRTGDITPAQFASGLSMARIELDPPEVALLVERFSSKKRPGAVRWQEFCDEIDEVHTCKRLEQNPTKVSVAREKLLTKRTEEKEPIQDEAIYKVLELLRETVRAKGVLLPPFFKDFDRHRTGRITAPQLSQVLSRHAFPLSPEQVTLLVRCYEDPRTRDVNYRRLIQDVDASEDPVFQNQVMATMKRRQQELQATSPLPRGFGFSDPPPPPGVAELLEQVRSKVVSLSVRIQDFFRDSDKLRKGCVPSAKFRSALNIAGLRFDERELRMLEEAYPSGTIHGYVDYPRFCNAVSPEADDRGLEKSPTKEHASYRPTRANPLKVLRTGEEDTHRAYTDAAIDRMRSIVSARRILPRPVFLDFDKTRKGRVTPTQFAAVLDKLAIKVPEEQTKAVANRFLDERGDVDYMSFCLAVDS
eukprot:TRINITY_DN3606_c2_g1_i1.p1 TRINITY_DN3606_c2_g1~~TRINITY_DN3606_c2_g1_i1.p1  ORF type:complete len:958 (+),score=413.58 TRINITY_DN3606_c2_g1_i1:106-2874(+)